MLVEVRCSGCVLRVPLREAILLVKRMKNVTISHDSLIECPQDLSRVSARRKLPNLLAAARRGRRRSLCSRYLCAWRRDRAACPATALR